MALRSLYACCCLALVVALPGADDKALADRVARTLIITPLTETPSTAVAGAAGALATIHAQVGAERVKTCANLGGIEIVRFKDQTARDAAIPLYLQSPVVVAAEPDAIITLAVEPESGDPEILLEPNDPAFGSGELWGLNNPINDVDIDAPEAWEVRRFATDVVIAVIDSGVNYNHEDLGGLTGRNMWVNQGELGGLAGVDDDENGYIDDIHGINTILPPGDPIGGDPMDDNGHGTHVAGTIAARGGNGRGIVGVAWSAQIMACKFLNEFGSGTTTDAIECIDYAVAMGADIMNNSWGSQQAPPVALRQAVTTARSLGIIFVAAAGNDGQNNDLVSYSPANLALDNVITVAATDRNDRLASFSNYGAREVELAAPGVDILSCDYLSPSGYVQLSGTSMAAPHVAGALAILMAQYPELGYRDLMDIVVDTADPVNSLTGRVASGGRLNLQQALVGKPINDDFADRITLGGDYGVFGYGRVNLRGAGRETDEPAHLGQAEGRSVWWTWTAPFDTVATVDTNGSRVDTLLAVYQGDALDNLTSVVTNDDVGPGVTTSSATFAARAGETFIVAVDVKYSGTGSVPFGRVFLNLGVEVPNDAFTEPLRLVGTDLRVVTNNVSASKQEREALHGGNSGGRSVWFVWTAPFDGNFTFSTLGSQPINTTMGLYTPAASFDDMEILGQNDDRSTELGLRFSEINRFFTAGEEVLIAIDGYNDGFSVSTGEIHLLITDSTNDPLYTLKEVDNPFKSTFVLGEMVKRLPTVSVGRASAPGFLPAMGSNRAATLSEELGELTQFAKEDPEAASTYISTTSQKTLWYEWVAPAPGTWTLSTQGSGFQACFEIFKVVPATPAEIDVRTFTNFSSLPFHGDFDALLGPRAPYPWIHYWTTEETDGTDLRLPFFVDGVPWKSDIAASSRRFQPVITIVPDDDVYGSGAVQANDRFLVRVDGFAFYPPLGPLRDGVVQLTSTFVPAKTGPGIERTISIRAVGSDNFTPAQIRHVESGVVESASLVFPAWFEFLSSQQPQTFDFEGEVQIDGAAANN